MKHRLSLDKCFITFFNSFYPISRENTIHRYNMLRGDMLRGNKDYNKFGREPGFKRTDFLSKNRRKCFYYPLLRYPEEDPEGKIISWILFDLQTGNAKTYGNINEIYMHLNNIPPPKFYLHEQNFIPLHIGFSFYDIVKTLIKFKDFSIKKYHELVREFDLPLNKIDPNITYSQLEFNYEIMNASIFALDLNKLTNYVRKYWKSQNYTWYLLPTRKESKTRGKIYEKAMNLQRIEFTYFGVSVNYDSQELLEKLMEMKNEAFETYNINSIIEKPIPHHWLQVKEMYRRILQGNNPRHFSSEEFDYLLSHVDYWIKGKDELFKRWCLRKKLIKEGTKRGHFLPTDYMDFIKKELGITNVLPPDHHLHYEELEDNLDLALSNDPLIPEDIET